MTSLLLSPLPDDRPWEAGEPAWDEDTPSDLPAGDLYRKGKVLFGFNKFQEKYHHAEIKKTRQARSSPMKEVKYGFDDFNPAIPFLASIGDGNQQEQAKPKDETPEESKTRIRA